MSALNIFLQQGPIAHIVTDGVGEREGQIIANVNKAFTLPHLGLAGSVRGTAKDMAPIQRLIGRFDDVAAMRAGIEPDLLGAHKASLIGDFDASIVGIDGNRPFGLFVSSQSHPGTTPFKMVEVDGGLITPMLSGEALASIIGQHQDDIDAIAVAIVSAQRAACPTRVGAFVQITSVTCDRIEQRILHRWPISRVDKG